MQRWRGGSRVEVLPVANKNVVLLIKRWDVAKGVEHYAVGIDGPAAWTLIGAPAAVVQLLPSGVGVESRGMHADWRVVSRAPDPEVALTRLRHARPKPFALLGWNCEHFARWVVEGKAESHQVQGAVVAAAALIVLCLAVTRGGASA